MKHSEKEVPPILAIVVPCFNEEDVIDFSADTLLRLMEELIDAGRIDGGSFVCFVDDGSSDHTWELIMVIAEKNRGVKAVKLAGNVGHQNALLAGLEFSMKLSDCTVTIDADLQDDVDAIAMMIEQYRAGSDIVFGVRSERQADSWLKRSTAGFYYRMREMIGINTIANHADFRLMSRKSLQALLQFHESNLYLRGICSSMGFSSSVVEYERKQRMAGETKYTLGKMAALAWDGITSFSVAPLRLVSMMGFLVFLGSIALSVWILYAHFVRHSTIPGWVSTVLPILFIGGIQLLATGVLGEYLGKTYLESKNRPRYLVDRVLDE